MGEYLIQQSKSGHKTLVYKNSRETRLHSAYDPVTEAERAVNSFERGRSSMILVSGLGLGYHVKFLRDKYPDADIVVVEHDIEPVSLVKSSFPKNIEGAAIIRERSSLGTVFETMDISGFRGISHYIHRPSYLLYKDYYDEIAADIRQYISSKVSDLLTRFEFDQKWVRNIFLNIPHMIKSGSVERLFGRFKGYPGIIVSAGPSLRKNIDALEGLKDRALIVAVDTAIKVLSKKNIQPHMVMTLDAQKYSARHFLGLKSHSPLLLADMVSFNHVVRDYRGRKIFSTTSKYFTDKSGSTARETTPVIDWIEKFLPPIGDLQSGGSVATSVFDLMLNLGCDPIILIGQDLAYTGREIHCSGTYHNDEWLPQTTRVFNLDTINQGVIRKRKIKYVEAFGGGDTVISDFVFDLYRGWFEDSAAKVSQRVINATEGGARIKNSDEMPLSEIARIIAKRNKTPDEIIKDSLPVKGALNADKLKKALKKAIAAIEGIIETGEKSEKNADLLRLISEKIATEGLDEVFDPFLRKVSVYISRHEPDEAETARLLTCEIIDTAKKLDPMFEGCYAALNKGGE